MPRLPPDSSGRFSFPDLWTQAFLLFDQRGNKQLLVYLLRSLTIPLPDEARWNLAFFIESHEIKNPPHRPSYPPYNPSPSEANKLLAKWLVGEYLAIGMKRDDAYAEAAKLCSLKVSAVRDFCEHREGAVRRTRQRQLPKKT
jgi:hypothetical protein